MPPLLDGEQPDSIRKGQHLTVIEGGRRQEQVPAAGLSDLWWELWCSSTTVMMRAAIRANSEWIRD
ncbi:hypothetical protein M2427_005696 [Bradyrhizobium sp. BR13661]|jgi:hypothetical protein|nr:hypothetical protein [Bradyrhizobium sp. BR13661]